MAYIEIRRPRTDRHKDSFIDALAEKIAHPIVGDITLSSGTVTLIGTINPAFHNSVILWRSTAGTQSGAVANAKESLLFLRTTVSNCLQVFKMDIEEGIFLPSDLPFYGLNPGHPINPPLDSEEKAMNVAKTVIDGEAARVLAGRPANARVARVVAALAAFKALLLIRVAATKAHTDADKAKIDLGILVTPILLTASNEIEGGYDTLTREQARIRGALWGLVWISKGTPSVFNIRYVDDVTGLTLDGVFAEIDETGASDTGNGNGEATVTTDAFGALKINSSRVDYTPKETPITILEGSINTIVIRMVKIII